MLSVIYSLRVAIEVVCRRREEEKEEKETINTGVRNPLKLKRVREY
jgi:hypothetical protein